MGRSVLRSAGQSYCPNEPSPQRHPTMTSQGAGVDDEALAVDVVRLDGDSLPGGETAAEVPLRVALDLHPRGVEIADVDRVVVVACVIGIPTSSPNQSLSCGSRVAFSTSSTGTTGWPSVRSRR